MCPWGQTMTSDGWSPWGFITLFLCWTCSSLDRNESSIRNKHNIDQRTDRAWGVHPGEERAPGRAQSLCQGLKGVQESCTGKQEGRSRLDRRKEFFVVRVVRRWHRLPIDVDAPCINPFRKKGS